MVNKSIMTQYDFDIINKSMLEFVSTSFKTLYETQRDFIQRQTFTKDDFRPLVDIPGISRPFMTRHYISVPIEMISTSNRLDYKRSPLYKKEVSLSQICKEKVFNRNMLVFVNGRCMINDAIDAYVDDGFIFLIFETIRNPEFFNSIERVDVISTKNFYSTTGTARITEISDNCLSLDVDGFSQYGEQPKWKPDYNYLAFFGSPYVRDRGMVFVPSTNVTENQIRLWNTQLVLPKFYTEIVAIAGTKQFISLPRGQEYFDIPITNAPFAVENMLVFYHDEYEKGYVLAPKDAVTIEIGYPNIYKVTNTLDRNLVIVPLMCDIRKTEYVNYSDIYYKVFTSVVDKYNNGSIDDLVKQYRPYEFDFNGDNFLSTSQYKDGDKYHLDKLREAVEANEEYLKSFLLKLIRPGGMLGTIEMSKLNLTERIRDNTSNELEKVVRFDKPHYVFLFKFDTDREALTAKWFLNGLLYIPKHFYTDNKRNWFMYIPVEDISYTAVLAVEKCIDLRDRIPVKFLSSANTIIYKFNKDKEVYQRLYDIHILRRDSMDLVPRESYSLSMKDRHGNWITTTGLYEEITSDIKITMHDPDYYWADDLELLVEHSCFSRNIQVVDALSEVVIPEAQELGLLKVDEDNTNYMNVGTSMKLLNKRLNSEIVEEDISVSDRIEFIDGQYLVLTYDNKICSSPYAIFEKIKSGIFITIDYTDGSTYTWDDVYNTETGNWSNMKLKIRPRFNKEISKITAKVVVEGDAQDNISSMFKNIKLERGWRDSDFSGASESFDSNKNLLHGSTFSETAINQRGIIVNKDVKLFDSYTIQPMLAYNEHTWTSENFAVSGDKNLLVHFWALGIKARPNYERIKTKIEFFNIHGDMIRRDEINHNTADKLKMITWTHIINDPITPPVDALYCRFTISMETMLDDLYISRPVVEETLYTNNYSCSAEDAVKLNLPFGSVNNVGQYVRVFINGRKVPAHLNYVRKCEGDYRNNYEPYYITNTLAKRYGGDTMTIDVAQIRSRFVYYTNEIPEDGYIDLRGYVKKPLDLRWHEIYLNGYRVNREMIDILSSTKFQFKESLFGSNTTCPTRWSLEVLERVMNDDDMVILDPINDDYHNKLVDKYRKEFYSHNIVETEKNIFKADVYRDKDLEFGYWFHRQYNRYFNPNELQVRYFDLQMHPTLCDRETGTKLMIIPDIPFDVNFINYINPNEGGNLNEAGL